VSAAAAIDPFVIQQAEIRASRMVGNYGYTRDDWEDLRQELLLDYMKRQPRFSPDRGDHRGFVRGVLRNQAAKLATGKRRSGPFSEPGSDAEWNSFISSNGDIDLRLDIQAVVSRLPIHLRILARQLSEMEPADVRRQTGKSRSRFYQWIAEIRAAFVEAGLAPAGRGGSR
jgi:RNA polymerase sigma-70 factor (ECF subfamily)